jgi:hypothetical protein
MKRLRGYAFEIIWMLLLIALFLLTPARSSAQLAFDWLDFGWDCSSDEGWCIPLLEAASIAEERSLQ